MKGFWDLPEEIASARIGQVLGEFRHTILHRHYRFVVRIAEVRKIPRGLRWFGDHEIRNIPLSTTARKALSLPTPGSLKV